MYIKASGILKRKNLLIFIVCKIFGYRIEIRIEIKIGINWQKDMKWWLNFCIKLLSKYYIILIYAKLTACDSQSTFLIITY